MQEPESAIKTAVFWEVTSCSLVDMHQRVGGICCLHFQDSATCTWRKELPSKRYQPLYQSTRRHIRYLNLNIYCLANAKFYKATQFYMTLTKYRPLQ
jgi:hypothetical protein